MPSERHQVDKRQPPAVIVEQPKAEQQSLPLHTSLPAHGLPPKPDQVQRLQRVIGNQAVIRLIRSNKRRLTRKSLKVQKKPGHNGDDNESPGDDFLEHEDIAVFGSEMDTGGQSSGAAGIAQRSTGGTIQRAPGGTGTDEDKIEMIQPIAGGKDTQLNAMMGVTKKVAEKANNPGAAQGVFYFIIADKLYIYNGSGQQVDALPLVITGDTTLPNGGYYLDDGHSPGWKTLARVNGQLGFHLLAFENFKNMQFSNWLSEESIKKVTSYRSQASAVMMTVAGGGGGGGAKASVGGDGAGKTPGWAADQDKRIQKKLSKLKAGGGGEGGTGKKGGGGSGGSGGTGDKTSSGDKSGEKKDYNPNPDKVVLWTDKAGACYMNVWVEGAHTAVLMSGGESDEELMSRIQDATLKMRQDADPNMSVAIRNGASVTAFANQSQPGEVTPGLESADAKSGVGSGATSSDPNLRGIGNDIRANTPAYPAKIINYGQDITVSGATNRFTMEIDYSSAGRDTLSQVTARMQPIRYYWELIDVTNVKPENREKNEAQKFVGNGISAGPGSGVANDLKRAYNAVAEDTEADLKRLSSNPETLALDWQARAAWLGVIAISDVVQLGGALISSYISLVTSPLNERGIGFDKEGEYVIRCVATPMATEEQMKDPDKYLIRASSVAVAPIKVMNINKRARAAADEVPDDIKEMKKQLEELPEDSKERAALMDNIHKREGENTPEGIARQIKETEDRIAVVNELDKAVKDNLPVEKRSEKANLLFVFLEIMNIPRDQYLKDLQKMAAQLEEMRVSADKMGAHISGRSVKTRTVLASEENGQIIQMLTMLGPSATSKKGKISYTFADVTSPHTRDFYEGTSSSDGEAGHREAIMAAFNNFRGNNGYGRGSLVIKASVPVTLDNGTTKTLEFNEEMRSAPGDKKRVMQRLRDLATAAEIAGIIVSGGAGLAVGAIGGLAGAIVAVDSMANRAHGDRLKMWDFETIMDLTAILGGALSLAQPLAMGARNVSKWSKRAEKVGDALHIMGTGMMVGQVVVIPASLIIEFERIEKEAKEQNLPPGEVAARRANAVLQAVRGSLITVIAAGGGLGFEGKGKGKKGGKGEPGVTPEVPPGKIPNLEGEPSPREPQNKGTAPKSTPVSEPTLLMPKSITDIKANNFMQEVGRAFGFESTPYSGRVRIVNDAMVDVLYKKLRGESVPSDVMGFRDTDANILYIPASKATTALRSQLQTMIRNRISHVAKQMLGEKLTTAYADHAVSSIIYEGGAGTKPASSVEMMLALQLESLVGPKKMADTLFGGDMSQLRGALIDKFGQARATAIEAAIKSGRSAEASSFLEPNQMLRNNFGELMSAGVEDLITEEMGGKPRNAERLALVKEIGQMVGMDVLKNALLRGDTAALSKALETAVGAKRARELTQMLLEGNLKGLKSALKEPIPQSKPKVTGETPPTDPNGGQQHEVTEPRYGPEIEQQGPKPTTHAEQPQSKAPKATEAVNALREALDTNSGGKHTELAERVLRETGDFKKLREMVDNGLFGESPAAKEAAQRVLQEVRSDIVNKVLEKVKTLIASRFPGIEITLKDPGTPGFRSDRDVTLQADGKHVQDGDLIRASLEAVNEAYNELNKQGLPPDRALDGNFYTELRENSVQPKNAAEAKAIAFDQGVTSLAEMRMQMSNKQWKAYKKEQMEKLGKGSESGGMQGALEAEAQSRMKEQFKQAEKMFAELGWGNPATREGTLNNLRGELLQALKAEPPKSAREIRELMAKIKLLEPDAYGARAAVEGVVDTQQALKEARHQPGIQEVQNKRQNRKDARTGSEQLAALAQEASASLGKMFSHAKPAGQNTSAEVRSLAKYLGRVFHAFQEAGLNMMHPLIDRAGAVVGAKADTDSNASTMRELRSWAQDTNLNNLTDVQLIEAYISRAQELGQSLVTRLRAAELAAHAAANPGEIAP